MVYDEFHASGEQGGSGEVDLEDPNYVPEGEYEEGEYEDGNLTSDNDDIETLRREALNEIGKLDKFT